MCRDGNVLRDENNLIVYVEELIADATQRRKPTGADNGGSPDADPLDQRKDEPPRYQVEKEK